MRCSRFLKARGFSNGPFRFRSSIGGASINSTMLEPRYLELVRRLSADLARDHLIVDPLRTLAYGADASFYRLIPKLVVRVERESDVVQVVRGCQELGIPYTFRAAGTSLS